MSYIIIVGGELRNKGAQAMTYTVVDELKKRYPDKEVIMFSALYNEIDEQEVKTLNFKVLPWTIRTKMKLLGLRKSTLTGVVPFIKYLIKGTGLSTNTVKKIKEVLMNAELMIDISGYALSSQRGYNASLDYLYNIMIAKKYNISVMLYPQSFGPFNYEKSQSEIIMPLIEELLQYPVKIYAREKEGIEYLKPFKLKNVSHSLDSVLQSEYEINLSHIFKSPTVYEKEKQTYNIGENAVAIVPNENIMMHGDQAKQYDIYKKIIGQLLSKNKTVYLMRHSYGDYRICVNLKREYIDNEKVILIEEDLDCIEINGIIPQFEFIIASRYHAIIHAYKNGVPALVFGWATKYQELLYYFSQEKYLFDVRKRQSDDDIFKILDLMLERYGVESRNIKKIMLNLPRNDFLQI